MEIVISLKELGLIILLIFLIVLVVYTIGVMRNLVVTIKKANKILEDTEVITEIAATRAKQADVAVGDLSEALGIVSSAVKGNQSTVMAFTNAVNAVTAIKNAFCKSKSPKGK